MSIFDLDHFLVSFGPTFWSVSPFSWSISCYRAVDVLVRRIGSFSTVFVVVGCLVVRHFGLKRNFGPRVRIFGVFERLFSGLGAILACSNRFLG